MNNLQAQYENIRRQLGLAYHLGLSTLLEIMHDGEPDLMGVDELRDALAGSADEHLDHVLEQSKHLICAAVREVSVCGKVSPSRAASRLLEMAHDAGFWELALMYQPKFR
ncbi:hypothetical protein [Thalassospira sp.]|uniref:hypothetical protein n=1 Tax=Thalassospira sp. TaxID=1912094 RepID=UPI00311FE6CF